MAEIFGFEIKRKPTGASSQQFTAPTADDGVQTIMGGGHFGTYLDIEGKVNNEADLIRRYREVAIQPECDQAIEDIINEAIVVDDNKETVRLNMNKVPFSPKIKKSILAKSMHKRIAKTILPCSVINCGPGLNPCATNAPNKIAVTLSPGIPNVNKGTNVWPFTALLAASGAAMPSNSPLPNFSGFEEAFLAAA